ncbi:hypothetical protein BpHYR1_053287 [Brachionus plicatilis]|uniref:Uncharacterized protein n=1 Tax=Brachionus plicatilis TaxID=10195 RepID=A0A3M7RIJ6_BRAPC|nr:hypothetical protein BpHYR1_053287 [Brachionus plicatilis]
MLNVLATLLNPKIYICKNSAKTKLSLLQNFCMLAEKKALRRSELPRGTIPSKLYSEQHTIKKCVWRTVLMVFLSIVCLLDFKDVLKRFLRVLFHFISRNLKLSKSKNNNF